MSRTSTLLVGLAALTLPLTACGEAGSSAGTAASGAASRATSAAASAGSGAASAASGAASSAAPGAAPAAAGGTCRPATGQQLVVLQDDKKLQNAENIIPAVNAKAATPPMLDALNKVQGALTQDKLISINRQVQVERKSSASVAKEFVQQNNLAGGLGGGSGKVVVGAANFAESETLANIYAEVLRAAGFDASVKKIGNRELYEPALEKGEIQVIPEYAGTLTEFLNRKQNGKDAAPKASGDVNATAQALTQLGEKPGLRFGQPAQAANANAFAVNKAFADANGLTKLSDLSKCSGGPLVLGAPPECPERPFCRPGLERTYNAKFSSFQSLDAGGPLTKTALQQGRIQVGLVFSSDPSLAPSS